VVIDPGAGVQAAIRDVFAAFAACGSAYAVVAAFAGRRFPLRAYGGAWAGQLRWGKLTHARVLGILKNPGYAGAYVFGRYASHRTVDPSGTVHTAMVERPRAEWPVLIKDHHEGYITWADYLANEARLAANHTAAGARPPREGIALCQGIIGCGSCGKPVMTNYHTDQRPAYECSSRRDRLTTPSCRSVAAACVDAAVAGALLDALTPGQVALALSAAGEVAGRYQRTSRAAGLAVERARYEADRAERAFCAVEPENRLVARSLEARWETRLTALAEAEQALEAARDVLPPLPSRDDLEKLAADLPALWHAPTTSARDRKRLLRTLIADVTLLPEPDRSKARIGIRWHTGATDELTVDRPVHPGTARRSPAAAIELVRRLGPATSNDELVTRLNAAGHRTGHGRPFDSMRSSGSATPARSRSRIPSAPARSPWPRPPGGWAAAPASSTTGSTPGSWPPAAAPPAGSASPGTPRPRPAAAPGSPSPPTWAGPPAPARSRHPRSPLPTAARSASPKPPASSAAAPASSTTGSKPGSSPPAAAPGTGCTSPGTTRSRQNAAATSANPGISTPPPGAPSPAGGAKLVI